MFRKFTPTVQATIKFLNLIKVKVNHEILNESLQNHPDWPSLLCITDTLTKWNIANGAGAINPSQLDQVPVPFLTRVNNIEATLAIVTNVSAGHVTSYQNDFNKTIVEEKSKFIEKWDGIYLIAESNEKSGEPNYESNKKRLFYQILSRVSAIVVLIILAASFVYRLVPPLKSSNIEYLSGIYTQLFVSLSGIIISIALIWYDIDKSNLLLKSICTNLVRSDCSAILTGKHAKVFSWLSWSEIGLFYFAGGALVLTFSNSQVDVVVGVLGLVNVLSLPYVFFSIYYQWQIAKQWCALCLIVQALIVVGFINTITSGFLNSAYKISIKDGIIIILLYLITPLVWYSLKPLFMYIQREKNVRRQYLRLKFNYKVFDVLLKGQKRIRNSVDHIGIVIGNPNAKNNLIAVCSVSCGPCSNAYLEIESLTESIPDLKVKIIFISQDPELGSASKPVMHLLSISKRANAENLKKALKDWYITANKDYDKFVILHPIDTTLHNQTEHIIAMNDWCQKEGIRFTPSIFFNGYQIPNGYRVQDLNYFILDTYTASEYID